MSSAEVRRWDPGGIDEAFRGFRVARDQLLQLDFDLETAAPPLTWIGTAAHRARAEHERLAEQLRRLVAGLTTVCPSIADDAVLFGSPGIPTDTGTDLHVPPGHLAVIEARGDAVTGWFRRWTQGGRMRPADVGRAGSGVPRSLSPAG